jgi:hypothetical protein
MKLGTGVTIGPTAAHTKSLIGHRSRQNTPKCSENPHFWGAISKVVVVVSLPIITRSTVLTNIPILIGVGLDLARGVLPVVSRSPHDLFAEHRLVG